MVFNHRIAACQLLARGRIYLTPDMVIKLAEQSIYLIILISAPLLLIALGVGLLVSVFQAMSQIQEQTLAFIPKILAVFLSLVIFGPWMLTMRKKDPAGTSKVLASRGGTVTMCVNLQVARAAAYMAMSGCGRVSIG